MSKKKTPSFNDAMRELEAILAEIEDEDTDIDQLATQLKRSTELLDLCRNKIRRAEVEVSQIVQTLDDKDRAEEPGEASGAEAEVTEASNASLFEDAE